LRVRIAIAEPKGEVNLACAVRQAAPGVPCAQATYQQAGAKLCTPCILLVSIGSMSADRIAQALERIESAMARIDAARDAALGGEAKPGGSSARVVELVNVHERLREQVAESLRELDEILAKLEE
jgi:hypothetical protein